MKRKILFWLKTEYQRAACRLPALLGKAVIFALLAGVVAFCGLKWLETEEQEPVRIGYRAEDSRIMELAVSFVENMESVKDWCELVPVSEKEGLQELREGKLAALLVLPDGVVEGILTGSNEPAVLYLAGEPSAYDNAFGMVFEELAEALVGMLDVAQAEIYATGELVAEREQQLAGAVRGQGEEGQTVDLNQLYQQIDRFNLSLVLNREQCFKERTLSPTGGEELTVYLGSVLGTIFLLAVSLLWLGYLSRSEEEQLLLARRIGIPIAVQQAGKTLVAFSFTLSILLPVLAAGAAVGGGLSEGVAAGAGYLLVGVLVQILWLQFFLMWSGSRKAAALPLGIWTIASLYLSGCLLPSALLPQVADQVSRFLPAAMLRKGFVALLSGTMPEKGMYGGVFAGILGAILCTLLWRVSRQHLGRSYVVLKHRKATGGEGADRKATDGEATGRKTVKAAGGKAAQAADEKATDGEAADRKAAKAAGRRAVYILHRPDRLETAFLLGKRLFQQKLFWGALLLTVALSAAAVRVEKQSDTVIRAAVCTGEEALETFLASADGLIRFLPCDTEEAVKRCVMRGEAECGYVLQEDLLTAIGEKRGNWTVTVYRGADFILTDVVNEVLFRQLFQQISTKWYEQFLVELPLFTQGEEAWEEQEIRERAVGALARKMNDQSTFAFATRYADTAGREQEADPEEVSTFPVQGMAAGCVGGSILFGLLQVWEDQRKQRFPRKDRMYTAVLTVLLPAAAGVSAALLVLLVAR